ncbi:poly-beta-hydroxybutyrate polymerase N-terminal domain-containing protein, partial [Klebsiella pneumoniae]|uniref:poly-beta-hydroxybutyrate polymerase N-terminal domain-containing protein n=1 Tax=Klebsiella pneumoniae TaxID=573 RepID=UPI003854075B
MTQKLSPDTPPTSFDAAADPLDLMVRAWAGRTFGGPLAFSRTSAIFDWCWHVAQSPSRYLA